jgi:hypothetical protein
VSFSLSCKETLLFVAVSINLEDILLSEKNQTQQGKYHLYKKSKTVELTEAKSRIVVVRS